MKLGSLCTNNSSMLHVIWGSTQLLLADHIRTVSVPRLVAHARMVSVTTDCAVLCCAALRCVVRLGMWPAGGCAVGQDGDCRSGMCTLCTICAQGHTGGASGSHQGAGHSAGRVSVQSQQQQPAGQGAV
jgi:hypothetical protein